mmetsp:Transcript_5945/g.15958  ORF Transcript_5945/g.15958 Transcript_5945/m.15958 type:complete len:210 (+) Transcript_5945:1455-2084(+)
MHHVFLPIVHALLLRQRHVNERPVAHLPCAAAMASAVLEISVIHASHSFRHLGVKLHADPVWKILMPLSVVHQELQVMPVQPFVRATQRARIFCAARLTHEPLFDVRFARHDALHERGVVARLCGVDGAVALARAVLGDLPEVPIAHENVVERVHQVEPRLPMLRHVVVLEPAREVQQLVVALHRSPAWAGGFLALVAVVVLGVSWGAS